MASLQCFSPLVAVSVVLFVFMSSPVAGGTILGDCGPSLLPLTPCTPFVQGSAPSPDQQCCDNLKLLSPTCTCLLLNSTILNSLPMINTTLALQMPRLCKLQPNTSTCPGFAKRNNMPSSSPRTRANSTVAASPMVPFAPRHGVIGFGLGRSSGAGLKKMEGDLAVVVVVVSTFLLRKALY